MHDWDSYVLNFAMVIATVWIVKRFWGSFFEKKKNSAQLKMVWIIFCSFQWILQYNSGNVNISMTFINVVLILAIAACGYHCEGSGKYFLLVVFCAVWSLVEILIFFLIRGTKIEQEGLNVIGIVISKLIMIIFVSIISVIWNKKNRVLVTNNFYIYLLFVPSGSIYIAVNQIYTNSSKLFSTITISILLLFNVVIFEIYLKMNEMFFYEKEKTVYAQQIDIISENTLEQKKIMEEFHEEKHNLINELIVLKERIEKGDRESVIRNINIIINNCNDVEVICNSGNNTVDAIINFKYAVAKEYDIHFQLKIFLPNELPIGQCDVGIVLGNAIDNAIEAVKQCKEQEKTIEISMGVKKESWVVVIRNPYEHQIKRDRNGMIVSTKQEKYRHGYGLQSIKKIVEKYQGEVIIDVGESTFSLIAVMNFGIF